MTRPPRLITCPTTARGHDGMEGDGLVHIEGALLTAFEALCDFCDTFLPWEDAPKGSKVTCPVCWDVYTYCRGRTKLECDL